MQKRAAAFSEHGLLTAAAHATRRTPSTAETVEQAFATADAVLPTTKQEAIATTVETDAAHTPTDSLITASKGSAIPTALAATVLTSSKVGPAAASATPPRPANAPA